MSERAFAVIGHPIGHTMSPFIHERLFSLAGCSGKYTVIDVAPEEFPSRIGELDRLAGYNVTIPDKQPIIPFLDRLDKRAEMYGSVNTVRNGEIREGFTTDPDGFLKSLETEGIPLAGDVVILGCGGVARTFLYEAAPGCAGAGGQGEGRRSKSISLPHFRAGAKRQGYRSAHKCYSCRDVSEYRRFARIG